MKDLTHGKLYWQNSGGLAARAKAGIYGHYPGRTDCLDFYGNPSAGSDAAPSGY